jgi:phage shock protein C
MASFCAACGSSLPDGARFCSSCGKSVVGSAFAAAASGPLMRPRTGRKVAGVCQGMANHYGWDVSLTRVIAVLLVIFTFPIGLLAYALFWLIMPEEANLAPTTTSLNTVT